MDRDLSFSSRSQRRVRRKYISCGGGAPESGGDRWKIDHSGGGSAGVAAGGLDDGDQEEGKSSIKRKSVDRPTVELKRSEVKRTIARKHLCAREEPLSDEITEIKLADSPQEPALSSLTHASAQLDNGASETSCLTSKNV